MCLQIRDKIGADTKLAFFNETRHAYGRTALLLSGGAGNISSGGVQLIGEGGIAMVGLGYYHVGFVKALFDQGLLPRVLSGASAGSIISSMIGVRTDDELYGMFTDGVAKFDFFHIHRFDKGTPAQQLQASIWSTIKEVYLDIFVHAHARWYGANGHGALPQGPQGQHRQLHISGRELGGCTIRGLPTKTLLKACRVLSIYQCAGLTVAVVLQ